MRIIFFLPGGIDILVHVLIFNFVVVDANIVNCICYETQNLIANIRI